MGLKKMRTGRHLSQEELAKLSGLNVRTIQRIENGGRPSMESLKCISSALEIDISILTQEITMTSKYPDDNSRNVITAKILGNHPVLLTSLAAIILLLGMVTLLVNRQEVQIFNTEQPVKGDEQIQPVKTKK